jgi:hypothetical protein
VAAVKGTSNTVHQVLNRDNTSLGIHVLHFAVYVFENCAYHAHNCDYKRAE